MHFFDDLPHDLNGAGAAGHNTGTHITEVCFGKIFMAQHGNKHGGHAVEGRNFFLIDTGKPFSGGESRNRAHSSAVGHGSGHGQHHTEAVEHRHLNHKPVGGG